ncbi:MAG: HAMP domain-containing sensor histidine kinase [Acidocella sp.]|nr:HAMP domain-containing sensor histidine kinase [Acidocella sp.]
MRLASFIRANIEPISVEWEHFASSLLPNEFFTSSVLRNHITGMLVDIANNIDKVQSEGQRHTKSEGQPDIVHYTEGAIIQHVIARTAMGLSFRQFISEFRALRATVLRLWQLQVTEIGVVLFEDMIRFNEAIDQILTEGTINYGNEIDRSRELFLGVLGHDLRNPLAAIYGAAGLLVQGKRPERQTQLSAQILVSAQRMSHLIDDLLELARVRLGSGIALHQAPTCLRRICQEVADEMKTAFPNRAFHVSGDDEVPGNWDELKLVQVVSNLVKNAVQHGAVNSPVTLTVEIKGDEAEVSVHNSGTPIPTELIPKLFDSFYRLEEGEVVPEAWTGTGWC